MYFSPRKCFRNQILLDYSGWWPNQSCQILIFQSVYSGVSGKGSNFAIFSANRRWPLQLLYYRTTVMLCRAAPVQPRVWSYCLYGCFVMKMILQMNIVNLRFITSDEATDSEAAHKLQPSITPLHDVAWVEPQTIKQLRLQCKKTWIILLIYITLTPF